MKHTTGVQHRLDIVAYCVRRAAALVTSNAEIIQVAHDDQAEYNLGSEAVELRLKQGWARRPDHGKMYGASYIAPYSAEIAVLFNRGVRTSADKMSPAQIRERLQENHPGVYNLPSESEIRSRISVLFSESKKNGGGVVNEVSSGAPKKRGRRTTIPDDAVRFIEELVRKTPDIKPQAGLTQVREKFPNLPDVVKDKTIKAKFSSLKAQTKKDAEKSLM